MRIYGTIDVLEFDSKGYSAAMKKAIETQFRQAARAFVRAAFPLVPVQSGMARGSYLNIGRFLRVAIPISPTHFGKKYYPPGGGSPIPKTPESGAALSTQPENIIQWDGNRINFNFETSVFHYRLEDLIGVRSAPWGSFAAGRAAFMKTMRELRRKIPSIKSYTTRSTITFGRGRAIRSAPIRLRQQEKVGE